MTVTTALSKPRTIGRKVSVKGAIKKTRSIIDTAYIDSKTFKIIFLKKFTIYN